jgi:hypothetical protein
VAACERASGVCVLRLWLWLCLCTVSVSVSVSVSEPASPHCSYLSHTHTDSRSRTATAKQDDVLFAELLHDDLLHTPLPAHTPQSQASVKPPHPPTSSADSAGQKSPRARQRSPRILAGQPSPRVYTSTQVVTQQGVRVTSSPVQASASTAYHLPPPTSLSRRDFLRNPMYESNQSK